MQAISEFNHIISESSESIGKSIKTSLIFNSVRIPVIRYQRHSSRSIFLPFPNVGLLVQV